MTDSARVRGRFSALWLALAALPLIAACSDPGGDGARDVPTLDAVEGVRAESTDTMRRAERFLAAGAPQAAEPLLREALVLDPANVEARRLLALLLIEDGRVGDGVPLLRGYLAERPRHAVMLGVLADSLVVLGELDAAVEAYRNWAQVDERADDAVVGLGRTLLELGRAAEAVTVLSRAERRRAHRADVRSDLGLAYQRLGELAEAETKQRDALARDEAFAPAWQRLGDVILLASDGREGEALDAYRRYLDLRPKDVDVLLVVYPMLRRRAATGEAAAVEEAERRWRTLLRVSARKQVGRPAVEAGAGAAARERRLRERLSDAPEDVGTRLALADLLRASGLPSEAAAEYDAVVAQTANPSSAVLAAAGAAHLDAGTAEDALMHLTRAVDAGAPPPTGRHVAWALLLLDRVDAAIAAYGRAIEADSGDAAAWAGRKLAEMRAAGR